MYALWRFSTFEGNDGSYFISDQLLGGPDSLVYLWASKIRRWGGNCWCWYYDFHDCTIHDWRGMVDDFTFLLCFTFLLGEVLPEKLLFSSVLVHWLTILLLLVCVRLPLFWIAKQELRRPRDSTSLSIRYFVVMNVSRRVIEERKDLKYTYYSIIWLLRVAILLFLIVTTRFGIHWLFCLYPSLSTLVCSASSELTSHPSWILIWAALSQVDLHS